MHFLFLEWQYLYMKEEYTLFEKSWLMQYYTIHTVK